jgi:hypothetical protein
MRQMMQISEYCKPNLITEYLSAKIDHVKADKDIKKLEALMHEFEKQYNLPKGMWANGRKLDTIVKGAQEILGDETVIQIWLPSTNDKDKYNENCFNCFGTTKQIAKDVVGLMPFTKDPIRDANAAKSLFYGKDHISNGNYLPFLAYSDTFYVKQNAEMKDGVPTFYLVKYYQSFL